MSRRTTSGHLITIGGLLWGASLRRTGLSLAGRGLQAVAVCGFLAMGVGDNLFHDVFLLASYASWLAVGAGTPASGAAPPTRGSETATVVESTLPGS